VSAADSPSPSLDGVSVGANKLVVTSHDLAEPRPTFTGGAETKVPEKRQTWAVVVLSCLVLCLPLLCLVAIAIRAALRGAEAKRRHRWNSLLCTLLTVSGLVFSLVFAFLMAAPYGSGKVKPAVMTGIPSLDETVRWPQFPSATALDAEQIAERCKPLVFIAAPDPGYEAKADYLQFAPIGAATLLYAGPDGYLFATNEHVIDAADGSSWPLRRSGGMLLFSADRESSAVEVAGHNKELDLALLWMKRKQGASRFAQPIALRSQVHFGEPVFAIGHPQRLFYTLSSGLVSRVEDPEMLQISAPVSPGNSGGPVYDAAGRLLGIVVAMVDRAQNPNAENLNFAVRADALFRSEGWSLTERARTVLGQLQQTAIGTNTN
jgi:hypothetical protein